MQNILFFTLLICGVIACKSGIDTSAEEEFKSTSIDKIKSNFDFDTLKGMYIGDFDGSDIRIVVNYISQNHAAGYNIHQGLQRNISGKVIETENDIILTLNEPGDHDFDGVFELVFSKITLTSKGKWKANNKKYGTKNFTLDKIVIDEPNFDLENLKIEDLNPTNFVTLFSHSSDTIGDFYFEQNGLVKYEFYPSKDTAERREQLEIIQGSWSFKKDEIHISWKKNQVFDEKKSIFKLIIKPNYEFYLEYKNRIIYPNFYGY